MKIMKCPDPSKFHQFPLISAKQVPVGVFGLTSDSPNPVSLFLLHHIPAAVGAFSIPYTGPRRCRDRLSWVFGLLQLID